MRAVTTIAAARRALARRDVTAVGLAEAALARAEACAALGAFVALDADGALRAAREADARQAAGEDAPLLGVPAAVKDLLDVAGLPTRGASRRWERRPAVDAAPVAALRAAGAIVMGKTHTNEFAFGIDGRNPHRPPCRNPHDGARLPGGSSSGSAVAVAAGIVPAALGTDTSGSLRVPAGLCGVVGLRPSAGRVSREGVLPLAPTYDVVGALTRDAADAATVLAVLADAPAAPARPLRRAGVVEWLLAPGTTHPAVAARVREAVAALGRLGLEVGRAEIGGIAEALDVHRAVQLPEAARSATALGVDPDDLAPDVRARVTDGLALAATYEQALGRRRELGAALLEALDRHDVLVAPTTPCVAPRRDDEEVDLGGGAARPVRDALLSCVVPFSQHGGPALSLPCGEVDGLPVGVQLVGRPGEDEAVLALAVRLEEALA